MTNAEARKLATKIATNPNGYNECSVALSQWALARLGQEDVMDAEVAEIEKRHEHFEGINAQTGSAGSVLHRDRATLLKKLRAVTPAVTLPTQPPKTISRGGIGWSHDDDPL